jgi:signal transduction histidine kinase
VSSVAVALVVLFATLSLALGWLLRSERNASAARIASLRTELAQRVRESGERAAAMERQRIYDDLHDDLGAKLLELVYAAPTTELADRARAALQDLRDVVTRSRGAGGTLEDMLVDVRTEMQQRFAAAGIAVAWDLRGDLPEIELAPDRTLHLYRIVREAVTNVIRHAHAKQVRMRVACDAEMVRIELTDDGHGDALDAPGPGTGMRAMRERAAQLAGAIEWKPGTEGGTKVLLSVPLRGNLA